MCWAACSFPRAQNCICRRLESLENQVEQLGSAAADRHETDTVRENAFKERFTSLDKAVREVSRSVQLVRDKQELLAAQAELSHLAVGVSSEKSR